jgi:hypothetical protein
MVADADPLVTVGVTEYGPAVVAEVERRLKLPRTELELVDAAPVKVAPDELNKVPGPLLGLVKPNSDSNILGGVASGVAPAGRVMVPVRVSVPPDAAPDQLLVPPSAVNR